MRKYYILLAESDIVYNKCTTGYLYSINANNYGEKLQKHICKLCINKLSEKYNVHNNVLLHAKHFI